MASLYIVGTPIGNLEDITLRALRVLRETDIILCEDTRVTKRLLEKYKISGKQLLAYNEQKSGASAERVIELLQDGRNIALVTDAGTPGISDPGSMLVQKVREVLLDVKIEFRGFIFVFRILAAQKRKGDIVQRNRGRKEGGCFLRIAASNYEGIGVASEIRARKTNNYLSRINKNT